MGIRNRAAIVGVAESELGVVPHKNVLQMQAEAALEALDEAGLSLSDVDALFTAGSWAPMPGLMLAEYLGIQPRYSDATNMGGCSFQAHVHEAACLIAMGLADVCLITYGSRQRSLRQRRLGGSGFNDLGYQWEVPYGHLSPIGGYALAARRHMHQYGTTREQLAEIAVATRKWAMLNPKAYMREPITIEDVLASEPIAEPLHRLDCCLVTDGGGAVVLTSAERAADLKKPPVYVLGSGVTHTHNTISNMPDLTVTGARESGAAAFREAGLKHHEIDVVEIYDSFTITVVLTLESLGFCGPGEGGPFVSGQRTAPGGDFPMNTNGGGLSYCHPGMYGIFLIIEAVRQLRGECGPRQVENAQTALVHGTGGVLSSCATVILGREKV